MLSTVIPAEGRKERNKPQVSIGERAISSSKSVIALFLRIFHGLGAERLIRWRGRTTALHPLERQKNKMLRLAGRRSVQMRCLLNYVKGRAKLPGQKCPIIAADIQAAATRRRIQGKGPDDQAPASGQCSLRQRHVMFTIHRIRQKMENSGLPTELVIDRRGILRHILVGYAPGQLAADVRKLLAKTASRH